MKGFFDEDMRNRGSADACDEDTPQSPLMTVGIFAGLIVLAAIICALLWHFTHLDKPADAKGNSTQTGPIVNEQLVEPGKTEEPSPEPEETEPEETVSEDEVTTLDGRVVTFIICDDYVTPKEYVNLRTEPSTTMGKETVRVAVPAGEKLHRTGIDYPEWNMMVKYCMW